VARVDRVQHAQESDPGPRGLVRLRSRRSGGASAAIDDHRAQHLALVVLLGARAPEPRLVARQPEGGRNPPAQKLVVGHVPEGRAVVAGGAPVRVVRVPARRVLVRQVDAGGPPHNVEALLPQSEGSGRIRGVGVGYRPRCRPHGAAEAQVVREADPAQHEEARPEPSCQAAAAAEEEEETCANVVASSGNGRLVGPMAGGGGGGGQPPLVCKER
jgi:hypothetical protein